MPQPRRALRRLVVPVVATVALVLGLAAPAHAASFRSAPTPVVTGVATVGRVLTVQPGTWKPQASLRVQWYRSGKAVRGATGRSYTLAAADLGTTIKVTVTGTRAGYPTTVRTSKATAKVRAGSFVTATPVVTGTAAVGARLSVSTGTWRPAAQTRVQWFVGSSAVAGATSRSFVVPASAVGRRVTVKVTGTRAGYLTTTRTSSATAAVRPGTLTAPVPAVTGTGRVGSTLRVEPGTWGPSPVTRRYQWLRDGTAVVGATGATYGLTAADLGTAISANVTGTKPGYATVTRTSNAVRVASGDAPLTVGGTLTRDTTWDRATSPVVVIAENLEVPTGVTLRIGAGVVVKVRTTTFPEGGIELTGGAVHVEGTSAAPVVLTSITDDTAGGDTNGDGDQSAPPPGEGAYDWAGIESTAGGDLRASFLDLRYASHVYVQPVLEPTVLTDSSLGHVQWDPEHWRGTGKPSLTFARNAVGGWVGARDSWYDAGPGDGRRDSDITLQDNTFTGTDERWDGAAVFLDQAALDPTRLTGNSSTIPRYVYLTGTLTDDWTVRDPGDNLRFGVASLTIEADAHVVVPAGATVGAVGPVVVRGALSFDGTSAEPVVLTGPQSTGDDSRPGLGIIQPECGATVDASYLHVTHNWLGNVLSGEADRVSITDSELDGGIGVRLCGTERSVVERNDLTYGSLGVSSRYTPAPDPRVLHNTVGGGAPNSSVMVSLSMTEIDPQALTTNVLQRPGVFAFSGDLPAGYTLGPLPNVTWSPDLIEITDLRIAAGTSLVDGTLQAIGGTLTLAGTAEDPVELTGVQVYAGGGSTVSAQHTRFASVDTGSVWGHTVSTVRAGGEDTLLLDDITFVGHSDPDDPYTEEPCIETFGDTSGHVRGDLSGCRFALKAGASFDARYVSWGHASGPGPWGAGARVEGLARTFPWIGYVAPPAPPSTPPLPTRSAVCAPNTILALRGSGETPGGPAAYDSAYYDQFSYTRMTTTTRPSQVSPTPELYADAFRGLGGRIQQVLTGQRQLDDEPWLVRDAGVGLLDELAADGLDVDTLVSVQPVMYPALSTDELAATFGPSDRFPFFSVDLARFASYLVSISSGIDALNRSLDRLERDCPSTSIMLVGYSQGALAIHAALSGRTTAAQTSVFDMITGVLLLADPLQNAGADQMTLMGMTPQLGDQPLGSIELLMQTAAARGLIDEVAPDLASMYAPYPEALASRTLTYCQRGDLFCAPQAGLAFEQMGAIHGGYGVGQLTALGQRAATFTWNRGD